ncbi:UNVERIFIED_CONTAM: Pentatricopeptide repeat-containing protein [Sesamum calycinum]|uniref:Pentatricopeptide repeat-containing protein n=2 Tax=Sesamum TaxID=4181 RepID=A0AAW2R9T4_9LAMI
MIAFSIISALKNCCFRSIQRASPFHSSVPAVDPLISLLNLLERSIETHSLKLSQQSHARARRLGLTQHPLIAQKLIFSCCQFKRPFDARLVFDSLLVKNTHICNTLLSGYGKNELFVESLELFRDMAGSSILPLPDDFTFSVLFKIIGDRGEVLLGKMVHARSVKNALVLDTVVGNSLMSMYGKCGSFDDSLKVFDEMPLRNVSSWNALISGYMKVNIEDRDDSFYKYKLWDFVKGMQNEGLKFDAFTVSTLLSLCGGGAISDDSRKKCGHGRELHSYIVRNGLDMSSGLDSDVHLGCCLIDMYSKSGKVDVGRRVFDRLKRKNIFAWTAMITGYVHCAKFDEALFLFREMQWRNRVEPNKVSLVAILPACFSFASLMGGKQIHGFAVRRELNHELSLCNALIDTYSKCGSLNYANRVFEYEFINKDAISWSSIISGYGLHGQGQTAVILFDKMLQNGMKPDTTVVVGVLSACCRSGLTNDGIRIYDSVVNDYNIKPTVEMCACMVDLFGRSGQLDQALNFIKSMPVEPGPSIWGALLSASELHGNSEMQDLAYKSLIKMEPDNSSNYISLSNLYAASKRWDAVAEVRKVMRKRGLRKMPGCSWISINSTTHSFFVADKSHPCSELIYVMLDELVSAMKLTSYDTDFMYLMEVSER